MNSSSRATATEWNIAQTILMAFIAFLKTLSIRPYGEGLSKEERLIWINNFLKPSLCPQDIGPSNHLRVCAWDYIYSVSDYDSEHWGLLFQINYKDINNDYRAGARMSRYPVFYLIPNFDDPDASKMKVDRRGIPHSFEALSQRQIVKKLETTDRGVDDKMPLDPSLRELTAFVQEMTSKVDCAYVSNKHDGSTLYATFIKRTHPSFKAIVDLLMRVPGGFGKALLAHAEENNYEFIVLPGTSGQLVILNEEQMAYHATAILSRHETYNGKDSPQTLLLKAIPYLMRTGLSVLNVLLLKGFLANRKMLDENTFGLMFEDCVPNLTDWCGLMTHRELTMVYPEGASYLFGMWYPTELGSLEEQQYGAFLPHTEIYTDLLELKIPQPCALKVPNGGVIDKMIQYLNEQLNLPIINDSYYETAVRFSDAFYQEFRLYFMGRQEHPMDNLISWEGFCVFGHACGVWEYVKVKLDAYYQAHKHATKAIPQILESAKKNCFSVHVFGSFARVVKFSRLTDEHCGKMIQTLHGQMCELQEFESVKALVEVRISMEPENQKVPGNLTQSALNDQKGRFWGTMMGHPNMSGKMHDFLESFLTPHFEGMGLCMKKIKNEVSSLENPQEDYKRQFDDSFADVWKEYQSCLKSILMYFGKNIQTSDDELKMDERGTHECVKSLCQVMIKFLMCART